MALDKLTTIQTSGIVATGIVTSNSFAGDGSGLTGVVGSGSGVVVQDDTSVVGTAGTIDFGTALDVSAISSGIVTVTASGGGSGSIAGIDTTATSIFSTLDIGADIDVDGHTELDNINIAGVTTFAGNIDANADIDIDGHTNLDNVSITGVTTFSEDVKFTGAASGRDITFDKSVNELFVADNAKVSFGNVSGTPDFDIVHDGNNTVFHNRTGGLYIKGISGSGNAIYMQPKNNESSATFHPNGAVELYFDNTERIRTTNTGAFVTGILTATSFVGDGSGLTNLPGGGSYGNSDVDTHLNRSSASSGEILSWNGSDYAWVADNVGSGSTAEVRSNTLTVSGISTFTGTVDINAALDVDGHTNLDNVSIAGVTTFTEDVYLRDDKYIYLGNDTPGNDAKIYFDEYNLLVQNNNTSGQTYIRGTTTRLDAGDSSSGFQLGVRCRKVNSSLITEIYGGSTRRILTTNSGVVVTGIMTATSFSGDGSALTGISGSIAGISTTGTSNFANIQLIGITTGLNVSGVLTAAQFSGDGANLTSLPAAQLSGTAAAINGSNITNLSAGNLSGTLPALDGSALTGIAVTEAPITNFTVTANGSSAYRFAGGGVNSSSNNPDLYLVRGQKYRFNNTTGSSHPFRFRVSSGGSTYSSGVSGSENGVQFFMVPLDAPAQLVYQCTIHGGMVGNIYIRGASGNNNNVGVTTISGGLLHINSGAGANGDAKLIIEADTDNADETANPFIEFKQDGALPISAIGHGLLGGDQNGLTLANGVTNGYIRFATTASSNNYANAVVRLGITPTGAVNIGLNPAQATGTHTQNAILNVKGYPNGETSAAILALIRGNNTTSTAAGHTLGRIVFSDKQAGEYAMIEGEAEANGAVGDTPGRLIFATASDGATTPSEKMRIDMDGNVKINTGNLVIGTSGKGIDFSISGGPTYGTTTQDSELLDDYEEGKITFESDNSGLSIDTSFKGRYTKIGELVTVSGYIVVSSVTSSSTAIRIKMPFTSAANSEGYYTRGVGATFSRYMNFPSNYHNMVAYVGGGENYMRFFMTRNAGASSDWHQMQHSNLTSNSAIYFNVCYTTTS